METNVTKKHKNTVKKRVMTLTRSTNLSNESLNYAHRVYVAGRTHARIGHPIQPA